MKIETSQLGTKIGKVFMVGILALIALFLFLEVANADKEYIPLVPQAQKTYDSARLTFCEAEKGLAQAKLMDVANGVKIEADLNALDGKRNIACQDF